MNQGPFQLDRSPRLVRRVARPAVERVLRFGALNRLYRQTQREAGRGDGGGCFADRALGSLDLSVSVSAEDLARVPATGPVVVVANHPFGGVEGLALLSMLRRVRPDVKLLANAMLGVLPELREAIFPVDVFEGSASRRTNAAAVRGALGFLKGGGCLGVFPAGEVSHLRLGRRCVTDPPWQVAAARLALRSGASVVCVHFDGRNSALFQLAGLVHPVLRTVMLPSEMLRRRGGTLDARVSEVVLPARLAGFSEASRLSDYLRVRTYLLRPADEAPGKCEPCEDDHADGRAAVAPPAEAARVVDEVMSLPAEQTLLSYGEYDVVFARRDQLDAAMHELGRLRELSFRGVGEGTGQALDLDRFDEHYLHLMLWHRGDARIVGAYRMGATDDLLPRFGVDGLYTQTLFRYRRRLFDRLGPCLELGRSFVRPEAQRSFQPLQLLWKGIAQYVVREPRYRYLIGPVSISARYGSMTKLLLTRFLELHRSLRGDDLPRPKHPPRQSLPRELERRAFSTVVTDLNEVNQLVSELEHDGKAMPVLLRQYLKLNAKMLGFNLDPDFGDVLDALVLIDLTESPATVLSRYMTRRGRASFMAHHGLEA